MDTIFTVSDPLGRSITLKSDTYNKKIANIDGSNDNNEHGNSHPDIEIKDIKDSVERPQFITQGHIIEGDGVEERKTITDKRQVYYKFSLDDKSNIFKTIVAFDDNNNGDIVTSFRCNKASSIKMEGGVIYDSTKREI